MSSSGNGPDKVMEEYQAEEDTRLGKQDHERINNYKERRSKRRKEKRCIERNNNNLKLQRDAPVVPADEKIKRQYTKEDSTWGDELEFNTHWPNPNENNTIRLVHYNVNGISASN